MTRQGKVWGDTTELWRGPTSEAHFIHARAGGYCSRHTHAHKWNRFCVLSGSLLVEQWRDGGMIDRTTLGPGDAADVPPGVLHRFTAPVNTDAVEVYWCGLEGDDIQRQDQGGIHVEP